MPLFRTAVFFLFSFAICQADTIQYHVFHVAPTGKPGNPGTEAQPFDSILSARNAIRDARKNGTIKENTGVKVLVAEGRYLLSDTITFERQDSGTERIPVVYSSIKPFGAQLIGGVEVPETAFQKVTDEAVLKRLDPKAKSHILVADLTALNIPAMPPWNDNFRGRPTSPPELFFDDRPMTVARWPNEGWVGFKTAIDTGMPHDDATEEATRKAFEKTKITFTHPAGDTSQKHGGTFVYDEEGLQTRDAERFARWKVEEGVWLCGYWTHDWSDEVLKVASIDTQNKTVTLQGVHGYGIGGRSWTSFKERRYYAMNLLEELDAPGEWYLDRKANRLYFYRPPRGAKQASIILSTLDKPLLKLQDAEFIRFEGFSLGPTFGGGIDVVNGRSNLIAGCLIRNTGRHGVSMNGGRSNRVHGCDLYNIGSVGISINGGDRAKLIPANLEASNNHIWNFGRLQRTYAGAASLYGVGNILRNNRMHGGPHLVIAYGGNENLIERNEIYDAVRETADAGALYTGRDWTTQGNIVRENFIHDLGPADSHGTMGVYLDDCDSGDTIERNVFFRAGRAVFIGGGRDNIVQSNLFIDCFQGISLDSRGMTWKQWNTPGDGWNLEEKAEKLNYKSPPWSERYPKLAAIMQQEPKAPLGCRFTKNVMIDCKEWLALDGNVLQLLERTDLADNIVVAENLVVENNVKSKTLKLPEKEQKLQHFAGAVDPGFVNAGKLDFQLKKNSKLQPLLPTDFQVAPLDKVGIYRDEVRTSPGSVPGR